jgi:hypothetical protein
MQSKEKTKVDTKLLKRVLESLTPKHLAVWAKLVQRELDRREKS